MKFCHQYVRTTILAILSALATPAQAQPVDLELVLAVDASGSVDELEYRLQLDGIAAGFRDPEVRQAIRSGPEGRIAVNMLVWAEHVWPKDTTGWWLLATDADAEEFARQVEGLPRRQNGATGLGEGLAAAVRTIASNTFIGRRRVVDVSGDGRETPAREFVVLVPQARAMAIGHGVTVNGLAIINEEPDLATYYRGQMQTGDGSFVIEARDYQDFAEAMRRKLLREIEHRPNLSRTRPVPSVRIRSSG
ncbi:MAG: DUF1194 domain-containing protein [Alphaproteobacteria bacterium]|nr:DUF1194 domain-containing protein [Alphaproteobacteria bacterium]